MKTDTERTIRTRPNPTCTVCGSEGVPLYEGLKDRMGGAPGTWDFKRCPRSDCGLIWLDPQPIEDDIILAYKDYYTHTAHRLPYRPDPARLMYIARKYRYDSKVGGLAERVRGLVGQLNVFRLPWYDHSVFYLPALRGGRFLEVGFGSGDALVAMLDLGWDVEGIDFDQEAVDRARGRGLDVSVGSLVDFGADDGSYDAIGMSHVIEHLHNPLKHLSACHRLLKPGGRLVVMTPNNRSRTHAVYGESCFALDPPRHLHYFSLQALKRLAVEAGFGDLRVLVSSRNARNFYLVSSGIRDTGRVDTARRSSAMDRARAIAFHVAEWLHQRMRPEVGEELVMIATKANTTNFRSMP